MYTLISATPSPYARKVRIALTEKELPFALRTEVPWNADTSTPQFNPLEKLPVLICPDGTAVYESRFILEWLEMKHPEPPLMPSVIDDILAVKRFEVLGDGICDALVLLFWENARGPEKRSPEWAARQQRKVDGGLREASRLLGDKEHCVSDRFTLADVATGCVAGLLAFRSPDHPWRSLYPNLGALSDRLERRPSFACSAPSPQVILDKVA